MENLYKTIIVWKDLTNDKIYYTKTNLINKAKIELLYNIEYSSIFAKRYPEIVQEERKLLYLFRIKTLKYGSVSVVQLQ
jgi:hypothetical protein